MKSIVCGICAIALCLYCATAGAQVPDLEECSLPEIDFGDDGLPASISDTIGIAEDVTIGDCQVYTDIPHTFIGRMYFSVTSPGGTVVNLHKEVLEFLGYPDQMLITWSDLGIPYYTDLFDCDCAMQPCGPGVLADFRGDSTIGDWTLDITDVSPSAHSGTLDEWCVMAFTVPAVGDLACVAAGGSGAVTLTWTNSAAYDEIFVYIDGDFESVLSGDLTSYVTSGLGFPGTAEVCVEAASAGLVSLRSCCTVLLADAATVESCDSPDLYVPNGGGAATVATIAVPLRTKHVVPSSFESRLAG